MAFRRAIPPRDLRAAATGGGLVHGLCVRSPGGATHVQGTPRSVRCTRRLPWPCSNRRQRPTQTRGNHPPDRAAIQQPDRRAKTPAEAASCAKRSLDEAKQAIALAPGTRRPPRRRGRYGRMTNFEDTHEGRGLRYVKPRRRRHWNWTPPTTTPTTSWAAGITAYPPSIRSSIDREIRLRRHAEASLEEAVHDYKRPSSSPVARHSSPRARPRLRALGQMDAARKEWQTELTLKPEDTK